MKIGFVKYTLKGPNQRIQTEEEREDILLSKIYISNTCSKGSIKRSEKVGRNEEREGEEGTKTNESVPR